MNWIHRSNHSWQVPTTRLVESVFVDFTVQELIDFIFAKDCFPSEWVSAGLIQVIFIVQRFYFSQIRCVIGFVIRLKSAIFLARRSSHTIGLHSRRGDFFALSVLLAWGSVRFFAASALPTQWSVWVIFSWHGFNFGLAGGFIWQFHQITVSLNIISFKYFFTDFVFTLIASRARFIRVVCIVSYALLRSIMILPLATAISKTIIEISG